MRLLLSRQNESADEYFIQVLVKQLKKSHSLTQQKKNLSKELNNLKIVHVLILRYHPPSSTLPALIGASAFAFNKYPHKTVHFLEA